MVTKGHTYLNKPATKRLVFKKVGVENKKIKGGGYKKLYGGIKFFHFQFLLLILSYHCIQCTKVGNLFSKVVLTVTFESIEHNRIQYTCIVIGFEIGNKNSFNFFWGNGRRLLQNFNGHVDEFKLGRSLI